MDKPVVQKIILAGVVEFGGRVLILQRSAEEKTYPSLWELPSGKREPFEKSVDGVVREILEESGLVVNVLTPLDVFDFKIEKETEIRDATQISFLTKLAGKPEVQLSGEHQAFAWISKSEVDNYNLSLEIKSVILKAFDALKI